MYVCIYIYIYIYNVRLKFEYITFFYGILGPFGELNDAGDADLYKNNGNDDDDDDANNECAVKVERELQTSIYEMIHWGPATRSVHDRAKVDSLADKNYTKYCRINYIISDRSFKIYIIIFRAVKACIKIRTQIKYQLL